MILWIILVLPWFSLFFVHRKTIKRFMPVTIFSCFLMSIIFQIAYHYEWWTIHISIVPWGYITDVSFAYGIFAMGTFWVFRLTSHRILLFLLANIIMDFLLSYVVIKSFLLKFGVAEFKNISPFQYFLITVFISLILYAYHKWQEKIFVNHDES
jgi:hypothetical protein